jgi:hypothetical protein
LIAGSTGSALRAVRSSNLHITPDARRDLVLRRKRREGRAELEARREALELELELELELRLVTATE